MAPEREDNDPETDELEERLRPELDEALLALDELAVEDPEEALSMFDSLPEPVQALPEFLLTLARAHQNLEQLEAALELTLGVLGKNQQNADAHHLAGDLCEDLGKSEEATSHFLATLRLDQVQLDPVEPEGALLSRISEEARRTLEHLPDEMRPRLTVLPLPSEEEVRDGVDPRALCRFLPGKDGGGLLHLYATNLHAEYGDLEEFAEFLPHVKEQIVDEAAQYLGLSEQDRVRYFASDLS